MTWSKSDIKAAYDEGERQGASHMIVAWDSFDGMNYPIYVMPGEDPRKKVPSNGDSVDECYRYSLGWEAQSRERRARHFEWDEPDITPRPLISGKDVKLHTKVYLSNGVLLPYSLRELPSMNRPAETGEAFVTLSDLEEFQETGSMVAYMNFDERAGQALVDAGWANMTTGHSHVATEEFRKGEILRDIYDRMEPTWDAQKGNRVEAIFNALSPEERVQMAQIIARQSG